MELDAIYERLRDVFPGVRPDHKGEIWITCPVCGKEDKHASFSAKGFYCFHCGARAGLVGLAGMVGLNLEQGTYNPVRSAKFAPAPVVERRIPWQEADRAAGLLTRYLAAPEREDAWAAYKPLSMATLNRYQFGYGQLPMQDERGWRLSKHNWLIVPLFASGKLVGLRGRNLGHDGPKWISASGTSYVMWGIEDVRPGDNVVMVENPVDAALLMERYPEYKGVALNGAGTWKQDWTAQLAARRPSAVLVALDNDLAGQATGAMYERLLAEWRAEHADRPNLPAPQPAGPRIANRLRAAGVNAVLFHWPQSAPAKHDIGALILQGGSL